MSIVLPRQHAQSLYHLLDRAQVQRVKAKQAVVDIMAAVETALAVKPNETTDEEGAASR